jgi:hypothetical protein
VQAIEEHRPGVSVVDVRLPPSHTDEGLRAAVEARLDDEQHRRVLAVLTYLRG